MTDKGEPVVRVRDMKTLEMKYGVGVTEAQARILKTLVSEAIAARSLANLEPSAVLADIMKGLDWAIGTAESDRKAKPDAVP